MKTTIECLSKGMEAYINEAERKCSDTFMPNTHGMEKPNQTKKQTKQTNNQNQINKKETFPTSI